MDGRQVFLLATHSCSREILRLFDGLRAETWGLGDSFILYHKKPGETVAGGITRRPHHVVDEERLRKLDYYKPRPSLIPGNTHLPLLCFCQDHHPYQFYWYIEYDVRFRGDWGDVFRRFDQAADDLLTCHVRHYAEEPGWYWWEELRHGSETIAPQQRLRSFNTVFRLSHSALEHIDDMHRAGWRGHHEVLLPTLLQRDGFRIRDLGGVGKFVAPGDQNRFYIDSSDSQLTDGTMRYRPPHVFLYSIPKGKLAHPVKARRKTRRLAQRLSALARYAVSPGTLGRRMAVIRRRSDSEG